MNQTNTESKAPMTWPKKPTKVSFWSRVQASRMTPPPNAILISIYDPSDGPVYLQPGWKAVLGLCFHDTDGSQMGLKVFDTEMARSILSFIRDNLDCEHIFVHCAAGQSRSAAVAMALGDEMRVGVYRQSAPLPDRYSLHNRRVYRILIDAIYEDCHDST